MGNINFDAIYLFISILVVMVDSLATMHCFFERRKYSHVLAVVCIIAGLTQISYLLSLHASSYLWVSVFSSIYFICEALTLVVLLTFIRAYLVEKSTLGSNILKKTIGIAFFIDAFLFAVNPYKEMMVHYIHTNGIFTHYIYSFKPLFAFHTAFVYSLVAVIVFYLFKRALSIPREYRRQYLWAVHSFVVVFLLNALLLFYPGLFGAFWVDYSIWGYSIVVFTLYLNFFRYPVKGMKSYYHQWIVENINQGVVLFNFEDNLIIHNDEFHKIFPDAAIIDEMSVDDFIDITGLTIRDGRSDEDYSFQIYKDRDGKNVPVRCDYRCLRNSNGKILGRLFVFTDETSDVDLLTSFYGWEKFKQILKNEPESFSVPVTVSVCDINGLGDINIKYGKNTGDQAIRLLAESVRHNFSGESYYVRGMEASLIVLSFDLTEQAAKEKLANVQMELWGNTDLDCIINIQSAVGVVNDSNTDILEVVKQTLKGMKTKKLLDIKSRKSDLVTSLVKTLEECDNDTEEHVRRTQKLGEELGKRLGLSDTQQSDLALLCILHDIGKIGIPLEILNKPGKLSEAEWRVMRSHTDKGYQIATSSQELIHIADMIRHHHESWDGHGYPDGLSKESIPLLSRIISVVDSYDAMTNDRVYRPARSIEEALQELKRCAGSQFDPGIVNEFTHMISEINMTAAEEDSSEKTAAPEDEREIPAVPNTTAEKNVHAVTYSRYVLDEQMRIVRVDSNFERLTGYTEDYIKNNVLLQIDLLPDADRTEYLRLVNEQLSHNDLAYFEHRLLRKDGTILFVFCYGKVYYDSAEKAERSEVIVFDSSSTYAMNVMVTEEKNKAELRLSKWENKYRCDSLTGLLNHEAFRNDVEMRLLEEGTKVMFLMMDVDKFKQYNDTYGHRAGDEFLIMLAQSLTSTLRSDDLACRMGGDEYAAALFYNSSVSDSQMLERAQQICDKLNMTLSSLQGGTSLSMGVVISGRNMNTFNRLYETSDKALYRAKSAGRARMEVAGNNREEN